MKQHLKGRGHILFTAILFVACALLFLLNINRFVLEDGSRDSNLIIRCVTLLASILAIGLVRIKLPEIIESIVSLALLFVSPLVIFEAVRIIINAPKYDDDIYDLNLVFYIVIELAIFILTQSPRVAISGALLISWAMHIADELVLLLRGTPLVPTDFYAIRTAMTITSPGEWHFNSHMITGTVAVAAIILFVWQFKLHYPKQWIRIPAGGLGLILCAILCVNIYQIDYKEYSTSTFDTESTNDVNGVALSFYINCRKMAYEKPEGYDRQALLDYVDSFEADILPEDAELPNIIVIMNESFSDLAYNGKLKTNIDYMPFFESLEKNYPHGRLLVSVLGGGTCNTEFEYLTGLSMLNMPAGSYAYMQHVTGEIPSMASYLKDYDYQTVAMHPFYEICWKRNSVYNFMGFDDFVSGEDMSDDYGLYQSADRWNKGFGDNVEYIRTLISDSYFYDRVIEQFENKTSDRIFIFGLTVQNHSGYEYDGDDFETDVHIEAPEGEYPRAEQYLSLVKDSDEALKELITYFEGVEEKTIIVFFGDHQPNVEAELMDAMNPDRNKFVNSYLARFQTPFVIWSNYEIPVERKYMGIISANYLGIDTLKMAGVPLSSEYKMIDSLRKEAAATATWGYYDRFNCWYDKQDVYELEGLNMYKHWTYYLLEEYKK